MENKKYMRAKELAIYLSCAKSTIWYWSANGIITPIKLSNRVTVFNVDEVEKALFKNIEVSHG